MSKYKVTYNYDNSSGNCWTNTKIFNTVNTVDSIISDIKLGFYDDGVRHRNFKVYKVKKL